MVGFEGMVQYLSRNRLEAEFPVEEGLLLLELVAVELLPQLFADLTLLWSAGLLSQQEVAWKLVPLTL